MSGLDFLDGEGEEADADLGVSSELTWATWRRVRSSMAL